MTNAFNISEEPTNESPILDWFLSIIGPFLLVAVFAPASIMFMDEIKKLISSKATFDILDLKIALFFGGVETVFILCLFQSVWKFVVRTYRHISWNIKKS